MTRETLEHRMVDAANIRAFEQWMIACAREPKIPWRWFTGATVTVSEAGLAAVVLVVVKLRTRAWIALGFLHFLAWWRVRQALGGKRNGYKVVVWVT